MQNGTAKTVCMLQAKAIYWLHLGLRIKIKRLKTDWSWSCLPRAAGDARLSLPSPLSFRLHNFCASHFIFFSSLCLMFYFYVIKRCVNSNVKYIAYNSNFNDIKNTFFVIKNICIYFLLPCEFILCIKDTISLSRLSLPLNRDP